MQRFSPRAALPFVFLLVFNEALPTLAAGEETPQGVRVTYLANEGFLIEAGETKVLVDALFGAGLKNYQSVPPALRAELEEARDRFAGVDLVLASHSHADHFDPAAVARHMRANPGAAFLSTREAVARLREELGEAADDHRIVAAYPDRGQAELQQFRDVQVRVLNLHHGRNPIENLGLIIQLGGYELLHVGDTTAEASDLRPYAVPLGTVDVWLLPDWLMGDSDWEAARGRATGETWLVNMHLAAATAPPDWFGSAASRPARIARIHESLPGAWIPIEPLASRWFPPPVP
jgi:L-ascorbate metabolism protein UlaG (beta-lactamase superfamily)